MFVGLFAVIGCQQTHKNCAIVHNSAKLADNEADVAEGKVTEDY